MTKSMPVDGANDDACGPELSMRTKLTLLKPLLHCNLLGNLVWCCSGKSPLSVAGGQQCVSMEINPSLSEIGF